MNYEAAYSKYRDANPVKLREKAALLRATGLNKHHENTRVPRSIARGVRALLVAANYIENGARQRGTLQRAQRLETFQGVEYTRVCREITYYDPGHKKDMQAFKILESKDGSFRVIAYKNAPYVLQIAPANNLIYASEAEAVEAAEKEAKIFEHYRALYTPAIISDYRTGSDRIAIPDPY